MPYITLSGIGAGVARLFWEQEAVSSNPTSPTIVGLHKVGGMPTFLVGGIVIGMALCYTMLHGCKI